MQSRRVGTLAAIVGIALAIMLSGCKALSSGSSSPSFCNGIDAQVGGCDAALPSFSGGTCEAVGKEAGRELNDRLLAVYRGPAELGGETRAVRASQMMSLVVGLANQHIRAKGFVKACGADEFETSAETQFSAEFRNLAGDYLYDSSSVDFKDWLKELRSIVQVLDMNEG
jgi:hypothetical protein